MVARQFGLKGYCCRQVIHSPHGVAIHGDLAYVTNDGSPNSVCVFNHANTDDGDRATLTSQFTEISSTYVLDQPIAVFEDRLYVQRSIGKIDTYERNSVNGQAITRIESIDLIGGGGATTNGLAVTEYSLFQDAALTTISSFQRGTLSPSRDFSLSTLSSDNDNINGFKCRWRCFIIQWILLIIECIFISETLII